MAKLLVGVGILSGAVTWLLLLGTGRICGGVPDFWGTLLGALLSGVYSGLCVKLHFLGNGLIRAVCLVCVGVMAFPADRALPRRVAVFVLLSLALGGVASGGAWPAILAAAGLLVLCVTGRPRGDACVPVELSHEGQRVRILALRDTGNTLRDPVTGRPVLVVDAQVAENLTGLSREQLQRPVESMGAIPGLRLIPYRTIGQRGAMMLGLKLQNVKIGTWEGSSLVAFAPEGLGGRYQALTGGCV